MCPYFTLIFLVSTFYWSYAVSTAVNIINRLPTPILNNSTPWEVLFKSKLDPTHLRSFGCIYFPLLRPYNTHKLLPHTSTCIFLGYPAQSKGYIFQDSITLMKSEFLSPYPLPTGPSHDTSLHSTLAHTSIPLMLTQTPTFVSCPSPDSHLAQ